MQRGLQCRQRQIIPARMSAALKSLLRACLGRGALSLVYLVGVADEACAQAGVEVAGVTAFPQRTARVFTGEKKLSDALAEAHDELRSAGATGAGGVRARLRLADLYRGAGDYAAASPLYEDALATRRDAPEITPLEWAGALEGFADLQRRIRDYPQAERLQKETLVIRRKHAVASKELVSSLHRLGRIFMDAGRFAEARPPLEEARGLSETIPGGLGIETGYLLKDLAEIDRALGDRSPAETAERAEKVLKEKPAGGKEQRPIWALIPGKMAEIIPAIAGGEKGNERIAKLGPFNLETARSHSEQAELRQLAGDYAEAQWREERALDVREKLLGLAHPETIESLNRLGITLFDRNTPRQNIQELAQRALFGQSTQLDRVFAFPDETRRLAFHAGLQPYSLFALHGEVDGLAAAVLRFKGAVLDSLAEEKRLETAKRDPRWESLLNELRQAEQQLLAIHAEPKGFLPADPAKKRSELDRHIQQIIQQITEAGLGEGRLAPRAAVADVQRAIPESAALIEFIRYARYAGKNKWEPHFGAVVFMRSAAPQWVELGAAGGIEQTVKRYHACAQVRHAKASPEMQSDLEKALQALHVQIWQPITSALPSSGKITRLLLSPDGDLNFVSFAALIEPGGQFLGERYFISYIASGRDLLRRMKSVPHREVAVFANPDFSGAGKPDLRAWPFNTLEGTHTELDQLKQHAGTWGWKITPFEAAAATEERLRSLDPPYILHLATHGYSSSQGEAETSGIKVRGVQGTKALLNFPPPPSDSADNPMLWSGVALAGAQATVEARLRGAPTVAPENDGLLTAQEAGALRLDGTRLVTLSACSTGLGEVRSGEGVLGLRRGFARAGARNILMTLWPIEDGLTVTFMTQFYNRLHERGSATQALAEVQREWLVRLRREVGLHAAVNIAAPFLISFQGEP